MAQRDFIDQMMPLAMRASAATGLDPRLILAQSALETGWGRHAPGNNFFGIKSHGRAGGNTMQTREVINGQDVTENASFRAYDSPEGSAEDYANFIRSNPRYKPVMEAQGLDAQIEALGRSGYATDPQYANKLRSIAGRIPDDRLAQADTGTMTDAGPEVTDPEILRLLEGVDSQTGGEVTDPDLLRQLEGGLQEGVEADQPPPPGPGFLERANQTAAGMVSDINAGFQGVNPVGVSKQEPIGEIYRYGEKVFVNDNGNLRPIGQEEFKNYITQVDPQSGLEMLYARTPEIEESPLASAGRVLGYATGVPASGGKLALTRPPAKGQRAAMQEFKKAGLTPTLGMTGPTGARIEGVLEGAFPSGGVIEESKNLAMQGLERNLANAAASVGEGAGPIQGGQALQEGANRFLFDNLKGSEAVPSTSQRLYARVDQAIPPGTAVNVAQTGQTLQRFVDKFANMPNIAQSMGANRWQKWIDDISANGGQMTWEQASALRSDIGEAMGSMKGPVADVAGGELKQIYGALSDDLGAAARAAGPGPFKAWKNATDHYKWARSKVDDALGFIFKSSESGSPEKAYAQFLDLGRDGSRSADLKKLVEIKKILPEDEWSTVVATVIRRMGEATPGAQSAAGDAFSANKFLTDWNKISGPAKEILFSGKGVPKALRAELDALATMMETAKKAGAQVNASRSGVTLANAALLAPGAVGDVATTFTAAVVTHLGARALTSPPFLRAVRNYIAKGGTKEVARGLVEAAGSNRALLANAANLIRLGAPEQPSGLAPLPPRRSAQPQ